MNTSFIHVDAGACIGCRTCEVSCAVNHQSDEQPGFHPRLRVYKASKDSAPAVCHQCEAASCLSACPTGALRKKNGIVEPVQTLCIGCKSCVMACPFGAVDIVAGAGAHSTMIIVKCDMCQHDPDGPACVRTCPTDALSVMTSERLQQLSQRKRSRLF